MAKGENKKGGGGSPKVISLDGEKCIAEGCGKKNHRANFCAEHFVWFKEGLLNKKGQRPTDFDKKYAAFNQRKPKTA